MTIGASSNVLFVVNFQTPNHTKEEKTTAPTAVQGWMVMGMDNYIATEQAYKNGYENGYSDGQKYSVDIIRIKETKQVVLQTLDTLIETDTSLYEWSKDNSYYNGKLSAFEISRRLINAALTDLCVED